METNPPDEFFTGREAILFVDDEESITVMVSLFCVFDSVHGIRIGSEAPSENS